MRYLNTLYVVDHRAKVGHRRGSLLVKRASGQSRVPLAAIDSLILLGSGQVTTDALGVCAKRGIQVASLYRSGALRYLVSGKASGNVHLRIAQYSAVFDEAHSLAIARTVIAANSKAADESCCDGRVIAKTC